MAFVSLKDFFNRVGLVTPDQFGELSKAWRVAQDNGSQEPLLADAVTQYCAVELAKPTV